MNESLLGWAIAGTGAIARRFATDMRHSKHGRIVAVASATPERAAWLATAIGPDVASGELDAVLRDPGVRAVYIAGRNDDHCRQALRCLGAGKAVLIEKPIATTAADAATIQRAASEAGLLAMEAMWMRFTPGMRRLKALIDGGAIGTVRAMDASLSFRNGAPPAPALLDLGVYPISLAVQLFGSPQRIAALASSNGADAGLALGYADGLVSIRCGFGATGPNVLSITGDRGVLATDAPFLCPSALTLRGSPPETGRTKTNESLPAPARLAWLGSAKRMLRPLRARRIPTLFAGSGLQYQAEHFAECLLSGVTDSPIMPLIESIEVIRIIEAATAASSIRLEEGQRLEA